MHDQTENAGMLLHVTRKGINKLRSFRTTQSRPAQNQMCLWWNNKRKQGKKKNKERRQRRDLPRAKCLIRSLHCLIDVLRGTFEWCVSQWDDPPQQEP